MDSNQFDRMIQRWSSGAPRRAMLGLLAGGALGQVGLTDSAAKKKKKVTLCFNGETIVVKKSKKGALLGQGATQGACAASPPPPPPLSPLPPPPPMGTCEDGIQNGDETDTDCGGACPRCADFKQCQNREDCSSALCANNVCITCRSSDQCGSDDFSSCTCNSNICTSRRGRELVGGRCADCPTGTISCDALFDRVICRPRCGVQFA